MMDVNIRKAQPQDAEQLIRRLQQLAEEPGISIALSPGEVTLTIEQEQKILADYAASESSVFLVADIQGQIIGDLTCNGGSRRATRHSAMLGMSIDREWRNKGIGSLLMTNAIEWARNAGISRIELYVFARNQVAIHLYEKFGFVVEGCRRRAVYRDGEYHDALIMALLL